jgi:hypothetical protein
MTGQTDTIEETMNRVRQQAAESLECAAESVRNAGDQGAAAISDLANGAGEKLDSSATLIRNFDGDDLITNLRSAIRRHPMARARKLTTPEVRHTTLDLRHMTMILGDQCIATEAPYAKTLMGIRP